MFTAIQTSSQEQTLHVLAPAKLNLFLHVLGRRADGNHLLQTVFTLLDWADELLIRRRADGLIVRLSEMPGVAAEDDLVVRAARLLQAYTQVPFGAEIHVTKNLPSGAGLGGGSSDAASCLMALNHLWQTGLSAAALAELGVQLGADVPAFIFAKTSFAEGIGEQLQALSLPPQTYVLIQPELSILTANVFKAPELNRNTSALGYTQVETGLQTMLGTLTKGVNFKQEDYFARNDLEAVAKLLYPKLRHLIEALHQENWPVRMTGSGSCFFLPTYDLAQAEQIAKQIQAWAQDWTKENPEALAIQMVRALRSTEQHPEFHLLQRDG